LPGLEQHLDEFHALGVEIAAISVDAPEESQKLSRAKGYTFPFLSDPMAQVIRQYGVLHPIGGVDGHDIARPAEFLVDSNGVVRWENFTWDIRLRTRAEAILKTVDALSTT